MPHQQEVLFKSSSLNPPALLVILKALEKFRVQEGLPRISLLCSGEMKELAAEFKYNSINCLVANEAGADLPAIDIDKLATETKDFDPLSLSISSRLRQIYGHPAEEKVSQLSLGQPFSFTRHTRLGDSISILSGLEAYCEANNIQEIVLAAKGAIRDVVENFDTPHIKLIDESAEASPYLEELFTQASWRTPWLKRFSNELFSAYSGVLPSEVKPLHLKFELPIRTEVKDVIYCQFDSRSHRVPSMLPIVRRLENLFNGREIRVIGGKETPPYLGTSYRYDLGNLREVITLLGNCSCFLGCDSGIAHLAGILGKSSVVVNFSEFEAVSEFFRSYPKSVVLDRRLLEAYFGLGGDPIC